MPITARTTYGGWTVSDMQAEIENINAQLKPKEKELWEAEVKLDAISGMKFLTEDDIRKEAEERSGGRCRGSEHFWKRRD